MSEPTEPVSFRNRIIGYGTKAADQFQAHPSNQELARTRKRRVLR